MGSTGVEMRWMRGRPAPSKNPTNTNNNTSTSTNTSTVILVVVDFCVTFGGADVTTLEHEAVSSM